MWKLTGTMKYGICEKPLKFKTIVCTPIRVIGMSYMCNMILVKLQIEIKTCIVTNWYRWKEISAEPFKFERKNNASIHVRMIAECK